MKKLMKKSLLLVLALTLLVALAACGEKTPSTTATPNTSAAPTQAPEKKVTIRWASSVSENEIKANNTPMSVAINTWIETVEKASNGNIEVILYPGSQLANGTDDTISGLLNGAYEMAQLNTGSWGDYSDAFAALNVPYLYTDYSIVHAVMDSDFGQGMREQIESDVGIKTLCYADIGYRHITNSRKPITSPADMAGLKIRTMTDSVQISAMEDLGAAVTPLSISELFSALQQKLVDAQENPLSTIYAQKYYEVQKYCTLSRHSYTTTIFFMNENFYNSLSDSQKAAIDEANAAATKASRAILASAEEEYRVLLEQAGMEFYELSAEDMAAFQEAVRPTWDKVKNAMGEEKWNALMAVVEEAKAAK